ncbi:MAG TPA: NAD(P)/FAD-dependent oxidoreductase [Bryobacteraceae bacterium]|nr:NAD(P)/FAD-dependent oxidoreductase [Bryobacteraceae bacterium]
MKPAYVIGSGPNGLTAAIVLARAGVRVTVLEAQPTVGGGARSAELTLPGFVHDVCSAVHPLAISSPVFAPFPLKEHGLEWVQPPAPLAHPLDGGECVLIDINIRKTASQLGHDEAMYRRLVAPLTAEWPELVQDVLAPPHLPSHPATFARFAAMAPWAASTVARTVFRTARARALFAGMAAHSILPLESAGSAAFGWILTLSAHAVGWPVARGGSQKIADALRSYFESLGGQVFVNAPVTSLNDLERDAVVVGDITPRQLVRMGANRLPDRYLRELEKYRYGPGVFKVDWALDGPIPWTNANCLQAATVHVGGTFEEIAESERAAWRGRIVDRPFVLLAQQSLFDRSRAPEGKHTAWAYCHVPNGSRDDMTARIEAQVERFAPGFRSRILARHTMNTAEMEQRNANLVGGDINGGAADMRQLFTRPTASNYRTPDPGVYLCSASTPPGGGVHGMCGYYGAKSALRNAFGLS